MNLDKWKTKFFEPPKMTDAVVLALLTVLITFQPFFIHGEINIFETGLYLPGIQAVLNGGIPFRDVFHLRGPFEIYMPAFLMKIFGAHINVLYSYFYVGSVLCLVLCVFLAKELLKTRGMLYLFVPVLIARTFPRVAFTIWGGMRYAFGLMALWFIIRFLKQDKQRYVFLAGIATSLGMFTSIEMGAYPFLGFMVALFFSMIFKVQQRRVIARSLLIYLGGMLVIIVPYVLYLAMHQAMRPYLDSVLTIVMNMQKVIDPHTVSIYPRNFPEAFQAMINPVHTNFKHMTPSYLYVLVAIYIFYKAFKNSLTKLDLFIICLGVYGFVMYNTGFRGIWAAQFEMALQPEKILLFLFLEFVLLILLRQKSDVLRNVSSETLKIKREKWKVCVFNVFCWVLILSSIGYSIGRFNHRFFVFNFIRSKMTGKEVKHLRPYGEDKTRALTIPRASGIVVPAEQADELESVYAFVQKNIGKDDIVLTYPEMGAYNFFIDRKFFGRFPISTFTWFNDRWFDEYMSQLNVNKPRYVLLEKNISDYWKFEYLSKEPNRIKFSAMMDFIKYNYHVIDETPKSYIMELSR